MLQKTQVDKPKGPKVSLQEKNKSLTNVNKGDEEPEELEETELDQTITQKVKVKYVKNDEPRYDSNGIPIKKGNEYKIYFVQNITICMFEPKEDPKSIKKQLEQFSILSQQMNQIPGLSQLQNRLQFQDENSIQLYSLLKK